MKRISFIGIGNELLNGKIKDKNTQSLAQYAQANGLDLVQALQIKDDYSDFKRALDFSLLTSDIIITSGGLGPTRDDKTKLFLAQYYSLEIKDSSQALEISQKNYSTKNREYPLQDRNYHQILDGSSALFNEAGFAPGLKYQSKDKTIFCFPGVPSEFNAFLKNDLPKSESTTRLLTYKTFGISESIIFQKIDPTLWMKLEAFGEVSSLPHQVGVDIGVAIDASSKDTEKQIDSIIRSSPVSEFVIAKSNKEISQLFFDLLKNEGITVSFAESCTGGLLTSSLTDFPGSSSIFPGSVVTYSNKMKSKELSVKESLLEKNGVFSEPVVLEMAKAAQTKFGADLAIATSGIAGPSGGSEDLPIGTLALGVCYKDKKFSELVNLYPAGRTQLKDNFVRYALFRAYKELTSWLGSQNF